MVDVPEGDDDAGTTETVAEPLPKAARTSKPPVSKPLIPARIADGTQLGRFRVIELLGEGGMGSVYRANDAELGRQVALKVLSGEGESAAGGLVEQRLMREAQALAKLNHPNVIAIYDVARDHGVAFVAMELVEGTSLDKWLNDKKPGRAAIIDAFMQAGRGLAAAHKEGLVHRDFKLANVILGVDGRIRVLDFGLARASESLGSAHSSSPSHSSSPEIEVSSRDSHSSVDSSSNLLSSQLTQVGRVVGTPSYMAPEQMRGREVDARSDQFSFCVALYRALYGESPFEGRGVSERLDNIVARRLRPAPAGSDVPPWLRKLLLRGLAAEPAERFPTMDALLIALADDPAPKRRRAVAIGLASLVLAGAGGFAVYMTRPAAAQPCAGVASGLDGVWSASRRAEIAKTFTASDKPFAKKMLATVTDALDHYGQAWTAMRFEACRATRVTGQQSGELLDLRMQCLDRHLDRMRVATDVLATADADVIEKSLQVTQTLPPLAECADAEALRVSTPLPTDATKRGQIEQLRADLARSDALFAAGKLAEGTKLVDRVNAQAPALAFTPLTAEVAFALGNAQYENGDYDTAAKTFANGAALALTAHRDDLAAKAWRELIRTVGYQQRKFDEAHAWAALAEAMLGRIHHDPKQDANLYSALSGLYLSEEQRDKALHYDELALEILQKTYGKDSNETAVGLNNLGTDYLQKRDFAKSRDMFAQALAIREKLYGNDHPATARALMNLAAPTGELGNIEESTMLLRRALGTMERALGSQHPEVATLLGNLGKDLAIAGKYDDALAAYNRAMEIVAKAHGPTHPQLAVLHARRGTLYRRLDKQLEGLAEYRAAFEIDNARDPNSAATGRDALDIAETLLKLQRYPEAQREYQHALTALEKALGPKDPELVGPLLGLGELQLEQKHAAAAIETFERALVILGDDESSDDAVNIRFDLADALWDSGRDRARARKLVEQVQKVLAADKSREKGLAAVTKWLATHR